MDNEIEPYRFGDSGKARELAGYIEIFVHAPYSAEMWQPRHNQSKSCASVVSQSPQ